MILIRNTWNHTTVYKLFVLEIFDETVFKISRETTTQMWIQIYNEHGSLTSRHKIKVNMQLYFINVTFVLLFLQLNSYFTIWVSTWLRIHNSYMTCTILMKYTNIEMSGNILYNQDEMPSVKHFQGAANSLEILTKVTRQLYLLIKYFLSTRF